jgi:diacylglycerol kinase (ATP)
VLVAVIINPAAGRRRRRNQAAERRDVARRVLSAAGVRSAVFVTEGPGQATGLSLQARADGARLVIAWGGDGTLNEVARALVETDTALGIVPAGSGNGLARALGIPRSPVAALQRALTAAERRIDAGGIGGRLFFNVAGVGFDAHVAHRFGRTGRPRGLRGYVNLAARDLFTWEPPACRVSIDGCEPVIHRALLLTLANGPQWGNGALIAPGAQLDDGLLDLVTVERVSPAQIARAVPRLFTGTIHRAAGVSIRRVRALRIVGDPPLQLHVDGEPVVWTQAELDARVHPGVLRVRA